jgi:hypothetical protein
MLVALALLACDGEEALQVAGEHGYVRCLALEPAAARAWSVGALRLTLDARRLRIEGAPARARVAVFTGPVDAASVRALRRSRPHLALMLGELGPSGGRALAALGVPVLFVAGGADRRSELEALGPLEGEARDRVIDATRLRSIRIGKVELVPVPGAPGGRYAIARDGCGIGDSDADAIAEAVGDPDDGVHRYLLSWAAPSGGPLSRGLADVEAGSPEVKALMQRVGAEGSIVAWPREHAGETASEPFCAVAPPLSGPWVERADGTRLAPDAMVLVLSDGGFSPQARAP